jgi:hypothetical protein
MPLLSSSLLSHLTIFLKIQLPATDTENNNLIMANEAYDDKPSTFQNKDSPEENAWFFSKITFSWERPLFKRATELGKKAEPLQLEDLLTLPSFDHGDTIGRRFEEAWAKQADVPAPKSKGLEEVKNNKDLSTTRLRKSLIAVIGRRFITAGFVKALNTCVQFSFPLLLNAILKFIQGKIHFLGGSCHPFVCPRSNALYLHDLKHFRQKQLLDKSTATTSGPFATGATGCQQFY